MSSHDDDDEPADGPDEAQPEGHPLRRFPRIHLALSVHLRFRTVDEAIESRTVDISEGGVFIRMTNPRPEGTRIRLQLDIGELTLEIGGVVVRCIRPGEGEPPGIGVLFTDIRDEDLACVKALVSTSMGKH